MLEHLSKVRFIEHIADFTHDHEWIYRGINPAVIVFHDSVHLYEKGLRDVYDSLKSEFPDVDFFQVLMDRNPEIAHAYEIDSSPTTMFIPLVGTPVLLKGFLTPKQAETEVRLLVEGKLHNKKK